MTPFEFKGSTGTHHERQIRIPAQVKDKRALFAFLAEGFPLPAYFGHNWDALEECLTDLDWMAPGRVALVHLDIPLADVLSDRRVYLQILAEAAKESDRLRVVFPEGCRTEIERLLGSS